MGISRRTPLRVQGAVCLGAAGLAGPLVAWWDSPTPQLRGLALATGPLALLAFAALATTWRRREPGVLPVTTVLAAMAGSLVLAIAYNPFLDPACVVLCVDVSPLDGGLIGTRRAVLVTGALLVVAAVGTTRHTSWRAEGWRHRVAVVATNLSALAFLGWGMWWGYAAWQAVRLWAPLALAGVLAVVVAGASVEQARRRRRLGRLVAALQAEGGGLEGLAAHHVPSDELRAEQRLGLVIAEQRARLDDQLHEVRRSQQRIVTRADAERRRIGRDLHDGAQQRLVGAALQLRIAADAADGEAADLLESAESRLRQALTSVRSLSQSIYPHHLDSEGLATALRELAAESGSGAQLRLTPGRPLSPEVSMALYAAVEATLRGHPARTDLESPLITVDHHDGAVTLTVTGLRAPAASDLVHVRDRVGALGGRLETATESMTVVVPCE
jgi:signal transduction histidine kinase